MDRLISEKEVLKAVSKGCCEWRGVYARCEEGIKAIPSAEPKTGHWKHNKCDVCGASRPPLFDNYCPNCGARMNEPQESEDKECLIVTMYRTRRQLTSMLLAEQ